MEIKVKEIEICKKLVDVEVSAEEVEAEQQIQINNVRRSTVLSGFRKGKAPKSLIEKRYGAEILDFVKRSIVRKVQQEAIVENKFVPAGQLQFSEMNIEFGKPLIFTVTFEVFPTVEVKDYKGIPIEKKTSSISEEEVLEAFKKLSMQKAQFLVVENDKIQASDLIVCDCKVKVKNKIIWKAEDISVLVSSSKVEGICVPDLQESLLGLQVGMSSSIKVNLDSSFLIEEYRNSPARVALKIKEIKRPKASKIDDLLAKELGFESLQDLKEFLLKRLKSEKEQQNQLDVRDQIVEYLLQKFNFELPKDAVKSLVVKKKNKYVLDLLNEGMSWEEIEKNVKALEASFEAVVVRDFKLFLILAQIAKEENIGVTEKEVENRVTMLAQQYKISKNQMKEQLEKLNPIHTLSQQLLESKVLDFLLGQAVVEELN